MLVEIVSVDWLNNNLNRDNLVILDASPISQTANKDTSKFEHLCIPTARKFNIKEQFTNKESSFPNTVPSESQFQKECQSLGIDQNSEIVVYDNLGIYTSPRVWWLFNLMGHTNIKVLDGGLPEWIDRGYTTCSSLEISNEYRLGNLVCNMNKEFVISYNDICRNIESNEFLVIDARSTGRFNGNEDEPRSNIKSGRIPKSVNIPYQSVLEFGKFKTKKQLKNIFAQKVKEPSQLVFSCGSGVTACIIMLACAISFQKSFYLFDGSWTEYAVKSKLLKEGM